MYMQKDRPNLMKIGYETDYTHISNITFIKTYILTQFFHLLDRTLEKMSP